MIPRSLRLVALNGFLVILYVMLGQLTFSTSLELGNVSQIMYAPKGVALAFSILFGARVAPSMLIGQTILSCWSGLSLIGGMSLGALSALETWLGGYLFGRWKLSRGFDRPRDVILFTLMIFCVLQPFSATSAVMLLYLIGMVPTDINGWFGSLFLASSMAKPLPTLDLAPLFWVYWWLTNSIGQLLVAPLLVAWLTPPKPTAPQPHVFKLGVMLSATVGVLLLIYYNPGLRPVLLALEYALMIWIGLRHSIRAVTTFNVLVMLLIIWESVQGVSFLAALPIQARQFYVAFFVTSGVFASLLLFSMFEERRDLILQLTELASKDALTQVSNRRYFMECAERELNLAKRHNYPLSLVVLDLDRFKTINDRYGHETGDQVLTLFAQCCRQILRSSDMAGRLGGEEFALLLPHTSATDAVHVAQRLRQVVQDQRLRSPQDTDVQLTFSAGVVESNPTATLANMYRAADTALYDAKHAGRDRVCTTTLDDEPGDQNQTSHQEGKQPENQIGEDRFSG